MKLIGVQVMFKSIKSKFIFLTILFIVLSIGIPTFYLIWQFRANFAERSEILVNTTTGVIQNCIRQSMLEQDKHVQQIVDRFGKYGNIEAIRIVGSDGIIKFSSDRSEIQKQINSIPHHKSDHLLGNERTIENFFGSHIYSVTEPIRNTKTCQKCHSNKNIIAYLDIDSRFTDAELRFYTGSKHFIYLSIVLVVVLFAGFYFFFTYFIGNPLKKVINALDDVEHGNFEALVDVKGESELDKVGTQFNSMVEQLKRSKEEIDMMHFEQLQRADKMVTLGELAAEMAHEINNPAGIIMSRADYLLLESEENKFSRKYSDDYEVILGQVNKISKITSSFLKYSKKLPKHVESINLGSLIENSLKILEPRLHKNNILIREEHSCDSTCDKPRIQGDPQQIEQVVINLLNNAIDSIEVKGEIVIKIKCLKDGPKQLTIKDTGSGMSEEVRSQIFSPFYTTKKGEKGTGLGLYIVKKICDSHNAELFCSSVESEGSTFIITFLGECK